MKISLTIFVFLLAATSFAATTGTLLLKSTVSKIHSLEVNPTTLASTLPLNVTQNNSEVATVKIKSNSNTGFKITISSANQGKLIHQANQSSVMPYSITYDSNAVNLVSGTVLNFPGNNPNARNDKVRISYTGVPHANLQQGDYTDTVTFTISSL